MLTTTLLALALQSVTPIQIDGELCHPRRLLVHTARADSLAAIRGQGSRVVRVMPQIGWSVIEVPSNSLIKSRASLRQMPALRQVEVEYDRACVAAYTPNDPLYNNQWGLKAMKVDQAWDISKGKRGIIVAVLDTGVEVTHEDLASRVWVNKGEIPGNLIDDDKNGYVDDVNGYDFVNEDADPADDHGHGTLCSGVIAGIQDNAIGVSGVAPKAQIMAMKVANNAGYFYDSDTTPGYLYAADNGARVFSCSFYSDRVSSIERDALEYAKKKGVLPVVAAGNQNSVLPYYPGAHEVCLSVAAIDSNLHKATFSNFGSTIDVAAPGVGIQTIARFNGYGSFSGTSLACPMVAGVAALLMSAKPTASAGAVRRAIEDTATTLNELPFGEYTNYGLVDAEAALTALLGTPAPAREPRFHFMTKVGSRALGKPLQRTRIQGRGFQRPATVEVKADGNTVKLLKQTRDYIEFKTPSGTSSLELWMDGSLIATVPQPASNLYSYPATESSTQGATVTGGFFETLMDDGTNLTCTQRGDGTIYWETVFRNVARDATMKLFFRRYYEGTVIGTETIEAYDWSTASFPYGSWVTLQSGAVPTFMLTSRIALPGDARRFLDVDGKIYVRVRTSSDLAKGASLKVDQLLLR